MLIRLWRSCFFIAAQFSSSAFAKLAVAVVATRRLKTWHLSLFDLLFSLFFPERCCALRNSPLPQSRFVPTACDLQRSPKIRLAATLLAGAQFHSSWNCVTCPVKCYWPKTPIFPFTAIDWANCARNPWSDTRSISVQISSNTRFENAGICHV